MKTSWGGSYLMCKTTIKVDDCMSQKQMMHAVYPIMYSVHASDRKLYSLLTNSNKTPHISASEGFGESIVKRKLSF